MLKTSFGPNTAADRWGLRMAVFAALTTRAAYCAYATGTVVANLHDFARPVLAFAALLLALAGSTALGVAVERSWSVSRWIAILDTTVAAIVMIVTSAALEPSQRGGALNWALAYSVGCSIWLAFGGRVEPGLLMSALLGSLYGLQALWGVPSQGTATTVTALVNAVSPVLFFVISLLVFRVVRAFAAQLGEAQARERRNQRESTALRERERLFASVHAPALSTLRLIAGGAPEAESRALARAEAASLRRALGSLSDPTPSSRFRTSLANVAGAGAYGGRRVELVDDEIAREPPQLVGDHLCDGVEALIAVGAGTADRPSWLHVASDEAGLAVVVRLPGNRGTYRSAVRYVSGVLGPVGGSIESMPALAGEVRFRLRVPAS